MVEGFPPAFKASGVRQHEYIKDSQNVGEYLEKLFGRLSALLFHIDRQTNNVLVRGGHLPKKLNQWATEARAMKSQVSDLLKEQENSVKCGELVEIGIRMITHLKKCPFKDEMMYDKPIPVIIRNQESSSEEPSRRLEEKYKVEESYLEGKQMDHKRSGAEQSLNTLRGCDVQKDHYGGTSAGTSLTEVELQKENVSATRVKDQGSEPISTSESNPGTAIFVEESFAMPDAVVSKIFFPVDSNSSSLSIFTEGDIKPKISKNMPISVCGFVSQQRVESEHHREFEELDKMRTSRDAEKYSGKQQKTEPTSSNTERIKHHEESVRGPIHFQEKGHYSVVLENKHLQLKLDSQIISIGDYPPLNTSPVNAMLSLVEQDLHELPAKPNYPNASILFLQRNKHLTLIHSSFFDSMPDLCFLDMSDTKIRILPSSLFKLSKLKVLLLRNCICLEKLPPEIGNLSRMEALDLSGTELYDLPDEIGLLALLRSLQLSFYAPDDESEYEDFPSRLVSPSFFSELKNIEALSVSVHPEDYRWNETVTLIIKDISNLEVLSYLKFYFPQVETFESFIQTSPSWKERRLSKFDFTVGQNVKRIASRVPDEVESLFSQEERCLRYVNGDKASPLIKSVLIRVTSFYLDHHTEVRSLSDFDNSNLQGLKFCVVRECPKMQAVLVEKNAGSAFPCLEYLGIYFLWELKHVWKPAPPVGRVKRIFKPPAPSRNFEALRYLTISTCPKLRFILWESMLQCLTNLEELLVEDCEGVEKIIKEENKKVKYENDVLPGLRKLVLRYLPELMCLGCGVRFSEDKISVHGCPKWIGNS